MIVIGKVSIDEKRVLKLTKKQLDNIFSKGNEKVYNVVLEIWEKANAKKPKKSDKPDKD